MVKGLLENFIVILITTPIFIKHFLCSGHSSRYFRWISPFKLHYGVDNYTIINLILKMRKLKMKLIWRCPFPILWITHIKITYHYFETSKLLYRYSNDDKSSVSSNINLKISYGFRDVISKHNNLIFKKI